MAAELDHLFLLVSEGAPEADRLVEFGLREGPSNRHPGQGTANRRFFFRNAMIELLWVSDPSEARSERTKRTRLWERWSGRNDGACPFGICLRPVDTADLEPPFPAWEYRPVYLPEPLSIHIAEPELEEPLWVWLRFLRRIDTEQRFVEHSNGIREITRLTLVSPARVRSATARMVVEQGILSIQDGAEYSLEVEFDGGRLGDVLDLRPHLPLAFLL